MALRRRQPPRLPEVSELQAVRHFTRLSQMNFSIDTHVYPLGSCTMKLNAAAEMMPLSWPEVNGLHPFAPHDQTEGYRSMFTDLEGWLAECTGFDAVSLQPNAGSQGEYAGLLAIKRFHAARGEDHRDICLIPTSAHGTNPASAVMCGFKVVPVTCDNQGNISVDDLKAKLEANKDKVAALMVTYPSTHGVFEESIVEICRLVHDHGGQVYMDGANLNALLGKVRGGALQESLRLCLGGLGLVEAALQLRFGATGFLIQSRLRGDLGLGRSDLAPMALGRPRVGLAQIQDFRLESAERDLLLGGFVLGFF